ncbi:MAG: hypothetical protein SGARI_006917 [Bacillariaceae sp.]
MWSRHPLPQTLADLTAGLASGMSIRYFPIFFLDRLRLTPVQVQILYIVAPLLQACLMKSGQYFSQRFGRCQMTIVHKWCGIAAMSLLIVLAHFGAARWMICVVYVLRTALMNSTSPLTKSLLMDSVPTHERGRWSALESVNMFSWSGSAFLGGMLVKLNGLLFNFSVTAILQVLATIPILVLMTTINTEEEGAANSFASDNESGEGREQRPDTEHGQTDSAALATRSSSNADP